MLQRLNGGSNSFVFVDETENPDQHRVGRQRVEHRKFRREARLRSASTSSNDRYASG